MSEPLGKVKGLRIAVPTCLRNTDSWAPLKEKWCVGYRVGPKNLYLKMLSTYNGWTGTKNLCFTDRCGMASVWDKGHSPREGVLVNHGGAALS